jgi:N-acylneuraminate cytidylyltransferase
MKIAFFLLARKGSKRIPNKNIKFFCGKPLIEYTLDFMKKFPYESHVFTDSKAIEQLCIRHLIRVHGKKYENKEGIHYTREELIFYNEKIKADILILLQATSPLRDRDIFCETINIFISNKKYDICFSVNKIEKILYNENGRRLIKNRDYNNKNYYYAENGSFYIFRKRQLEKRHITNGKKMLCEDKYDIDLDTLEDWKKAEILYKGNYYEN